VQHGLLALNKLKRKGKELKNGVKQKQYSAILKIIMPSAQQHLKEERKAIVNQ